MSSVVAAITTSLDGYVAGPDDAPGRGLGVGGERLHYWVFGGPWTYADGRSVGGDGDPDAAGAGSAWLERLMARIGAVVGGRGTYEAGGAWGGTNPWPVPFFIVTHRPQDEPASGEFRFVDGLAEAIGEARSAAGGKDVHLMGGADVIRGALAAGLVDELTLILAPVVLGGGKRLFDGFTQTVVLEQLGVSQSRWATFIDYRVA